MMFDKKTLAIAGIILAALIATFSIWKKAATDVGETKTPPDAAAAP